jgi:4-aminobutyrate aminotransferase-like enzyme
MGRGFCPPRPVASQVAHVGHSHPRVAAAVSAQVGALNTNTRYLHPNLSRLAQRLTAKLPSALSVCFFVNSGSEANDLALRLARAHTGHEDVVVVDRAYHGHTSAVIDISPYKYEHAGGGDGGGRKPWVHQVPCPDTFRGAIGAAEPDAGPRYAAAVAAACRDATEGRDGRGARGIAAFFVESGMSVAGRWVGGWEEGGGQWHATAPHQLLACASSVLPCLPRNHALSPAGVGVS